MSRRLVALIGMLSVLSGCAGTTVHKPWWASADVGPTPQIRTAGSIYAINNPRNLYGDVRARRVGDLLTVVINEQAIASKQASTQLTRQGSVNNTASTIFNSTHPGSFNLNAGSSNKFTGSGKAAQQNSLTTTLTAMVTHVLPNGDLVIEGSKKVILDSGPQYIKLSGIVRPSSIEPGNTVLSGDVADATIQYTGSGAMRDTQNMGWLQRILMTIWPF